MRLNWKPPKTPSRKTAVYTWDPVSEDGFHYAALVRNGGRLRNGTDYPARKFDEKALEQIDLAETFADEFKRNGSLEKAFQNTALAYARETQRAISSRAYSWPRETVRKSGEIAGRRRDIVDEGNLRDSQKLEFRR